MTSRVCAPIYGCLGGLSNASRAQYALPLIRTWDLSSAAKPAVPSVGGAAHVRNSRPTCATASGPGNVRGGAFPGPGLVNQKQAALALPDSRLIEGVGAAVDRMRTGEHGTVRSQVVPGAALLEPAGVHRAR